MHIVHPPKQTILSAAPRLSYRSKVDVAQGLGRELTGEHGAGQKNGSPNCVGSFVTFVTFWDSPGDCGWQMQTTYISNAYLLVVHGACALSYTACSENSELT